MDSRQRSRSMKLVKAAKLNQPIPIINQRYQTRKKIPSTESNNQTNFLNDLVFEEIMTQKDNVGVDKTIIAVELFSSDSKIDLSYDSSEEWLPPGLKKK